MSINFSNKVKDLHGSAIRESFKALAKPGMISFAGGMPDPSTYPNEILSKISAEILKNNGTTALQYGISEGYAPLIEQVQNRLSKINVYNDDNQVIIVSGGQQGLELTAKCFVNEGEGIACENPSFVGAMNAFRSFGAKLYGIEMDEEGMIVDKLEETVKNNPSIKMVYTIPTFQNPSGRTMSKNRRLQLLEVAKKYNLVILEDNPYGELRFSGEEVPTIKSLDKNNQVVYCGSFSKIIAPGLRVGFLCAKKEWMEKIIVCKQVSDVHTTVLTQMVISEYLKNYDIEEHIKECSKLYGDKCAYMKECIKKYFPSFVSSTTPEGGIFLWCDMNNNKDSKEFGKMCIENNVAMVAGASCAPDLTKTYSSFRLNYSMASYEKIEEGIKIMGGLIERF